MVTSPNHDHGSLLTDIIDWDFHVIKLKIDPQEAIERLYFNAYSALIQILRNCCDSIKSVALDGVGMQPVCATEEQVKEAHDISALFRCLKIDEKWNDLHFLKVAISLLPPEASKNKEAARMVLNRYDSYFRAYTTATSIKEGKSVFGSPQRKQGSKVTLTVMEVVVDKEIKDYTCKDCIDLWKRFLIEALEIPEDHIQFDDARRSNSTTLVFMVPLTVTDGTKEKLSTPAVVWVMKELGILRVHVIGVFNVYVHKAPQTVPTGSIRDGLKSGVDFIALTKVCVLRVRVLCMCVVSVCVWCVYCGCICSVCVCVSAVCGWLYICVCGKTIFPHVSSIVINLTTLYS